MRSLTTRLVIVISSLLIAAILAVQLYWLNTTYRYGTNEFNTSVLKVVRGVYEDIPLLYNINSPLDSLVEKRDGRSFLFSIDSIPSKDSLMVHLRNELEDFHVFTDCRVALYDHKKGEYIYDQYISADASKKNNDSLSAIPIWKNKHSYIHLYFPNRQQYIIHEMSNWIYSSAILLALLVGFAASVYFLLKQKFLVEIQKDFINNVTHEFSTPLSVIDLSVEALEKPSTQSNPEKWNRYLSSIRTQSAYLNNHIHNLVNTVVVGQYHLAMESREVPVNELLRRAVIQLEPLLQKKNGQVIWHLEEKQVSIPGDESHLYLVFFNVLNNAIKYSESPIVTISTRVENSRMLISVEDNGPGIEVSQQRKIFSKFYRAPATKQVKGLGLGLYFSKKVVDAHQGQIRLESIPGKGTIFTIDLPLKK
ncbi:MAG: HAMP domain-containing histidine kinase [Chitinophagaceae bacterium]|nr:HAMP domain-containing histidine kinase [Chitinophagaceae bacterium]